MVQVTHRIWFDKEWAKTLCADLSYDFVDIKNKNSPQLPQNILIEKLRPRIKPRPYPIVVLMMGLRKLMK